MEKIDRNFMWMAAANLTGSLFNVILFIYLARVLGADSFGYLSYATSIVFYLFNFVDLGLATYGARETARDKTRLPEYVSNIVSVKMAASSILFIVFVLLVSLSKSPLPMKVLMAEAALMLFTSALATEWAFQGIEKMHMVFISLAATSFLQLSLNMIFVKGPDNLLLVPLINFLAAMPIIVFFLHRLGFKPVLRGLDIGKIRCYLSSSIVIWAISVFAQVYNGLDIAILGFFRSPEEVGCFTIARRAIGGVSLLMIFLANALLPHLSSSFGRDTARFNYATRRFLKLSLVMIILVFLPAVIFSKGLISLTVGAEYAPASGPLAIMGMALILVAFNLPFSTGLIAAGMEKEVLKQAAASAALNIVSNFILIPKYGMIGAAISFLLAEALALVWILHVYNKKMKLSERRGDDREKRV